MRYFPTVLSLCCIIISCNAFFHHHPAANPAYKMMTGKARLMESGRRLSRLRNSGVRRCDVTCKAGSSPADKLRKLLKSPDILVMPCCYDGLTARLVEMHGFPITFMTGFGTSAVRGKRDRETDQSSLDRIITTIHHVTIITFQVILILNWLVMERCKIVHDR